MSDLARFFAAMEPLLTGRTRVEQLERSLGPSPSGTENLDFYRVLVERNLFKILRDVYAPIRVLALRQSAGLWAQLVRRYAAAHPPTHWEPNMFAAAFGDFLTGERERMGEIPELFEELADFQWIRHSASRCPDDVGDGFEQRVFVRQYSYDVPRIAAALERDEQAPLPGRRSVVVLVYRHARTLEIRTFHPTAAGLAALARRQGIAVPAALEHIEDHALRRAEVELVEHGILLPRGAS